MDCEMDRWMEWQIRQIDGWADRQTGKQKGI
jgi:hypothetical protein